MRKITAIVLSLLFIIVIMPGIMGVIFEKKYQHFIAFENAKNNIVIETAQYNRGWFSSTEKLTFKITNPFIQKWLAKQGISYPENFMFEQTIHHGPFLYQDKTNRYVGLAAIHTRVGIPFSIKSILQPTGLNELLSESDDSVSFSGSYLKRAKTSHLVFDLGVSHSSIEIKKGIQVDVHLSDFAKHVKGDIKVLDFMMSDDQKNAYFPQATIIFDQIQKDNGLWVGTFIFKLPMLQINSIASPLVEIKDLNFKSKLRESQDLISGYRNLQIKKILIGDLSFGPLEIKMSAKKINANAVLDMISTYQKIARDGELYQSQLQRKMLLILPSVFQKNTEFRLDTFKLHSPDGLLSAQGYLTWPTGASLGSDFSDLLGDSAGKGQLRIAIPLFEKIIDYLVQIPYFQSASPQQQHELISLDENIRFAKQRNFLVLSQLVDRGSVAERDALDLLDIQTRDQSLADYQERIRNLFITKQISLPVSYLLFWKYLDVRNQVVYFEQAFSAYRLSATKKLRNQIESFIQKGVLIKKNNDYVLSVQKNSDSVKVNGKEI